MSGDPTLFARRDEVEEAWQFVDVIEQALARRDRRNQHRRRIGPRRAALYEYPAGSWGPKEADDLPEQDGRKWRRF